MNTFRLRSLMLVSVVLAAGCRQPPQSTRIELTTVDEQGLTRRHYTEFSRSYYLRNQGGLVEVVLESDQPSSIDPTQTITQIVHIKQFWDPHPGRSYAEATQINARVQYALLTPPTGVRYDGSAFLMVKIDKVSGELVGWLESGTLSPRYQMGGVTEPFGPSRIEGEFRAVEAPGKVVRAVQMLASEFQTPIDSSVP